MLFSSVRRQMGLLVSVPLVAGICAPPLGAAQTATIEGTVIGYSAQSALLNVMTPVGSRNFLVNTETLIILNGRSSSAQQLTANSEVEVRYEYPSYVARRIDITREAKRSGTIRSATTTTFDLKIRNAVLTMRPDNNSRIDIEGLALDDRRTLAGLQATVIYEPGTLLVLSAEAQAQKFKGKITALNTTTRVMTVTGTSIRDFTVDTNATIRRDGVTAQITGLAVDDKVTVVFVKAGAVRRALILEAKSPPPAKE